jgi:hypothetical protein
MQDAFISVPKENDKSFNSISGMDHGRRDYPPSLGNRTVLPDNGNDRGHL